MVAKAQFREDLFFRLGTHHIQIPPLRDRMDDIPLLIDFFIDSAALEFNKRPPSYTPEVVTLLQGHPFPGNIRELRALIFDAVGCSSSPVLSLKSFNALLKKESVPGITAVSPPMPLIKPWLAQLKKFPTLKETTAALIQEALSRTGNNQRAAALLLGISPQALNQRLKKDRH